MTAQSDHMPKNPVPSAEFAELPAELCVIPQHEEIGTILKTRDRGAAQRIPPQTS